MALDHYVSQVHLKRFSSTALGERMYALRKSDLKAFTPPAKDVCRIDEGNTNDFLTEPRAIEEFLKGIEPKYNAAVSALEEGKPDKQVIYVIAGFVGYVMTCSPAAMRINTGPLQNLVGGTAKLMEGMGKIGPPPPALGGKDLADLLETGKVKFEIDPKFPQAIGIANIFQRVAMFGNFRWEILANEHDDCPFFTSDFPIANEPSGDVRVLNRIVPLTPNLAIRILPDINIDRDKVNFDFEKFTSGKRKVKRTEAVSINRLLVQCAEDTVFFRDNQPWVAGFIEKNRHFRIETEVVEFPAGRGVGQWSRQVVKRFQHG